MMASYQWKSSGGWIFDIFRNIFFLIFGDVFILLVFVSYPRSFIELRIFAISLNRYYKSYSLDSGGPHFDISDALQHPQSASRTLRVISSKVIWMSIGRVYSAYNSPNKELMFGDFLLSEYLKNNISQLSGITWLSSSGWPYQSESSVCFRWLQIPFLEEFEFYGPFFYSPSSITSQNKW